MQCSYCRKKIPKTQGIMKVKNTGEKNYFCSHKCEKNFKNKRNHEYPDQDQ